MNDLYKAFNEKILIYVSKNQIIMHHENGRPHAAKNHRYITENSVISTIQFVSLQRFLNEKWKMIKNIIDILLISLYLTVLALFGEIIISHFQELCWSIISFCLSFLYQPHFYNPLQNKNQLETWMQNSEDQNYSRIQRYERSIDVLISFMVP